MSATARVIWNKTDLDDREPAARRISPELESVILDIARSERELDGLLHHSERLHTSHIEHDPMSCLVCFSSR